MRARGDGTASARAGPRVIQTREIGEERRSARTRSPPERKRAPHVRSQDRSRPTPVRGLRPRRRRGRPGRAHRRRRLGGRGREHLGAVVRQLPRQDRVPRFFKEIGSSIEVTEFTPLSFTSNETDVIVAVHWAYTVNATGKRAEMTMQHWCDLPAGRSHSSGAPKTPSSRQPLLLNGTTLSPRRARSVARDGTACGTRGAVGQSRPTRSPARTGTSADEEAMP